MTRAKDTIDMPDEVDFSNSMPNPYVGKVRHRITINIDDANIEYFKDESQRTGVPYQTLINLYLTECRVQKKQLTFA